VREDIRVRSIIKERMKKGRNNSYKEEEHEESKWDKRETHQRWAMLLR